LTHPLVRLTGLLRPLGALLLGAALARSAVAAPPTDSPAGRDGGLEYADARLSPKPPRRSWQMVVIQAAEKGIEARFDPKFNAEYRYLLQVDCYTERKIAEPRRGQRDVERVMSGRFAVHYLDPRDEPLARRVGAVLGRLYWVGFDYLGRTPPHGRLDLWLTRTGEAGGEEYEGNIYLLSVQEPRTPVEWVREVAHEYGHVLLPRMGAFTEPERWASGYLAERLFLKWMLADNASEDVWDAPIDGRAYVASQVAPLRALFLEQGPGAPAAERTDAGGMRFFIGEMLALEAMHGPGTLRRVLDQFATPRPQNLGAYLSAALREPAAVLPLNPLVFVPSRFEGSAAGPGGGPRVRSAVYWLFLPAGHWQLVVESPDAERLGLTLEGLSVEKAVPAMGAASWTCAVDAGPGAWHRLTLTASGNSAEVRGIRVSRQ
jgi:hypothetical protein